MPLTPRIELDRPSAIVFDVDGTLYEPLWVRAPILCRIVRAHATSPRAGVRLLRALRAYRAAQERLRAADVHVEEVGEGQLRLAADSAGMPVEELRRAVARWMDEEPLALRSRAMRDGLQEFLEAARASSLPLGVCSDYPSAPKLSAMGLSAYFDVTVSAQDGEVQRFKPDPRGLLIAARRLGVAASSVIYVGDRPEIDAVAAARAGMRCVIVGRRRARRGRDAYACVSSFRAFAAALALAGS